MFYCILTVLLGSAISQVSTTLPSNAIPQIDVVARPEVTRRATAWRFDENAQGWAPLHECVLSVDNHVLKVQASGDDPYFHRHVDLSKGTYLVRLKARSKTSGGGCVYWATQTSPGYSEDRSARFPMIHDGQWHDYTARVEADDQLTGLRVDPGSAAGVVEIDHVELDAVSVFPVAIQQINVLPDEVQFALVNTSEAKQTIEIDTIQRTFDAGEQWVLTKPLDKSQPLEAVSLVLKAAGFSPFRRTLFVHHPSAQAEWTVRKTGPLELQVARNGRIARICRDGKLVALLAPIVHFDGLLPELHEVAPKQPQPQKANGRVKPAAVQLQGDGVTVKIDLDGDELAVTIDSEKPCEGPVVRTLGDLEQGLFAGLEYLGKGETSSSSLDVETNERFRFAPDRLKVTLPLMAVRTDRASVAVTWRDMQLQPIFAVPNFFDQTPDHRMALQGQRIEAFVRVTADSLEDQIRWAVQHNGGLPPLPKAPRTEEEQWALCLAALNGPLHTEQGWGHCAEDHWARHPFADHASTIWRLTGHAPELPQLVPGGAHVRNSAIYFVTGRARQWLDHQRRQVDDILRRQQPDGSFHYQGKYTRGHFEDTASGYCALPAMQLLEYARATGDRKALAAACKTLDYMRRFRTPRGAQTWELSLHTPDQLASAYLVWAYVRGYELTGDESYLADARRWALSGVPFVYLWGCHPTMLYGTPPVYGATNWQAPLWIGLPVQWVGGVYAYALHLLAPHDETLDWDHLARGILNTAEQMQYPDGQWVGLLPDSLELTQQERRPWRINPCALVSLRRVLDGKLDALAVAIDGDHRVVAPFPVTLGNGTAEIDAQPGVKYQVLVDGQRIVDVESQGHDVVRLDQP